ncbi:MAG TPA: adenylate/guanylate cyclase domain-containing protein [Casimicrobiaceae bacterium]|nr:adenylate/guanylate cyclase domain-containing protein [Casimicrobiaceae bacterium]
MRHKLTVIVSADVVGYSGLMERDESGTLERLKQNRKAIFDPRVAAHGGRIVKLMGDGALVEFGSVVSAVICVHEIQEATEADRAVPEPERIRYRIGVTLGEVIVDGDDIYGDGVNVAARLQTLAPPGGVAVSRPVRDQAAGKVPIEFDDLGEHTVRNIERPVHVFAMRVETPRISSPVAQPQKPRLSICVLPFANMSGDPEQEYFSDGITEDIITDLSKVSALTVVSRVSAFSFKGKPSDVGQIARALKVSHVLEGSVRKSGNRVRITAQLIEGATDSHLWAERYDRDIGDIFALQDDISEAIVKALKLTLLPAEREAIERRSTTNPEAYKLYLMARQYNATGNSRHREVTIRLCKRAVEIDPNYARAWALLSLCQANTVLLVTVGRDTGWGAAERALALAPDLAEAHAAKGRVLGDAGRYDESLAEHAIALRLDPDAYEVNAAAARCFVALRRHREAIECLDRAAAALETDFWALGMSITSHEALGDRAGAVEAARRTLERVEKVIVAEPDHGVALGFGVTALAVLREADRAKEWAARAMLLDPENYNLMYNLACGMIRLQVVDEAIKLLEPVFRDAQVQSLNWWKIDSDLDPIRNDPRFQAMLAEAESRLAATPGQR